MISLIPLVFGVTCIAVSLLITNPKKMEEGNDLEILRSDQKYYAFTIVRVMIACTGVLLIAISLVGLATLQNTNQLLESLVHIIDAIR